MIKDGKAPIVGSGEARRSMSYVDNTSLGLLLAAASDRAAGETYWIADERPYSMNEIVDTVEDLLENDFGMEVAHDRMRLPVGGQRGRAGGGRRRCRRPGLYHQKIHVLSEMNKTIACSVAKGAHATRLLVRASSCARECAARSSGAWPTAKRSNGQESEMAVEQGRGAAPAALDGAKASGPRLRWSSRPCGRSSGSRTPSCSPVSCSPAMSWSWTPSSTPGPATSRSAWSAARPTCSTTPPTRSPTGSTRGRRAADRARRPLAGDGSRRRRPGDRRRARPRRARQLGDARRARRASWCSSSPTPAGLKHVLFLDVMIIAAGFVLRALAGLVALDTLISEWLLLCTGLLALSSGWRSGAGRRSPSGARRTPSARCSRATPSRCSTS